MDNIYGTLDCLNHLLLDSNSKDYPFGLAYGRTGLIIYSYQLYHYTQNNYYKEKADSLLDVLLEKDLNQDCNLTVEDGLCGVSLGLNYLIRSKFIEGDINELAQEIDNKLFQEIVFEKSENGYFLPEMIHWIYYIYYRVSESKECDEIFIWQELAIKLINKIANLLDASFFKEPYSFSLNLYHVPLLLRVILKFIDRGFYTSRLMKILEQISSYLFSHIPYMHLNRLYLLWGILPAKNLSTAWQYYIEWLRKNIVLDKILAEEMKGRSIYINNGIPFLYILLESLKREYPEYAFNYSPLLIYERIIQSDAWSELESKDYYYQIHQGLLNGFPGSVLTLLDIKNKYL